LHLQEYVFSILHVTTLIRISPYSSIIRTRGKEDLVRKPPISMGVFRKDDHPLKYKQLLSL
ncbi:MAG: hypothetical protein WBV73_16285, partial [Phormidium sp.]